MRTASGDQACRRMLFLRAYYLTSQDSDTRRPIRIRAASSIGTTPTKQPFHVSGATGFAHIPAYDIESVVKNRIFKLLTQPQALLTEHFEIRSLKQ